MADELDELLGLLSDEEEETAVNGISQSSSTSNSTPNNSGNPSPTDNSTNPKSKSQSRNKSSAISEVDQSLNKYACDNCRIKVDVTNRNISYESLNLRLRSWKILSINALPMKRHSAEVKNKQFAIIGVLASKKINQSVNGGKYMLLKLTDLKLAEVVCFVFDAKQFHKIAVGTVLAIVGAKIMDSKDKNALDIALSLNDADNIATVGKSPDFGYCQKITKNQQRCQNVINKNTAEFCAFHAKQQYQHFAARRNDVNHSKIGRSSLNHRQNSVKSLTTKNGRFSHGGETIAMIARPGMRGFKQQKRVQKQQHKFNEKMAVPGRKSYGMKTAQAVIDKQKKEQLTAALKGKSAIPQLGRGWAGPSPAVNRSGGAFVFTPAPLRRVSTPVRQKNTPIDEKNRAVDMTQKRAIAALKGSVIAPPPDPNDTSAIVANPNQPLMKTKNTHSRKRKFAAISGQSLDCAAKKPRLLSQKLGIDSDRNDNCELMAAQSLNSGYKKDLELESLNAEIDILEKMENTNERLSKVTNVQINVFVCSHSHCAVKGKPYERINSFCLAHRSYVKQSKGKKFFWKCSHCNYKFTTINKKFVNLTCGKCGYRKFVADSAYNLSEPKIKEPKLRITNSCQERRSHF